MESLTTPILLLIYNRPDTTKKVFDAIRRVKPSKLYIFTDTPPKDRENDYKLCMETRAIVSQIDWECNCCRYFEDRCLGGCDNAVRTGIDWFFSNEVYGIILEDDCVPNDDFFFFCQSMLKMYENNSKIMLVGCCNPSSDVTKHIKHDYYFSRSGSTWGWGTWKRAWDLMVYDFKDYNLFYNSFLRDPYYNDMPEVREKIISQHTWEKKHPGKVPWDSQLNYTMRLLDMYAIISKVNLIQNIGTSGTHSSKMLKIHQLTLENLDSNNIIHPEMVEANYDCDLYNFRNYLSNYKSIWILYYKVCIVLRKLNILNIDSDWNTLIVERIGLIYNKLSRQFK